MERLILKEFFLLLFPKEGGAKCYTVPRGKLQVLIRKQNRRKVESKSHYCVSAGKAKQGRVTA